MSTPSEFKIVLTLLRRWWWWWLGLGASTGLSCCHPTEKKKSHGTYFMLHDIIVPLLLFYCIVQWNFNIYMELHICEYNYYHRDTNSLDDEQPAAALPVPRPLPLGTKRRPAPLNSTWRDSCCPPKHVHIDCTVMDMWGMKVIWMNEILNVLINSCLCAIYVYNMMNVKCLPYTDIFFVSFMYAILLSIVNLFPKCFVLSVLFHPSWPPEAVLSTGYLPSCA